MKKTTTMQLLIPIIGLGLAMTACKKKKTEEPTEVPSTETANYVVLTTAQDGGNYTSYYTPYAGALPSGSLSNIGTKSLQQASGGGISQVIGDAFFRVENASGEAGIEKLQVEDGSIKSKGFISANTTGRFGYVNANLGYYLDADRGLLKLQKFNPTTMQRTGEVDFTAALDNPAISEERIGHTILAVKGGKLFANLHYGTTGGGGFLDAVDDTLRIVVIDLATEKVEKISKFATGDGKQALGYPSTNPMSDFDDNGDFYFISLGTVVTGSGVYRIKANETEIDKTWRLRSADFGIGVGTLFAFCTVKNGTIYTRLNNAAIASDFSNLYAEIYEPFAINASTKIATKIGGVPPHYFGGYANQIAEFDGKLYFGARNTAQNVNALFEINGTTATKVFSVTAGGDIIGVAKLAK